jgi:4-hydroxybenzoate polyprenyltransferase
MYALQYFVVGGWLQVYSVPPMNAALLFALTVISTLCIAAAGFVANDYFDTRIDELNRPDSVIVGKAISREHTMLFFQTLAGLGIVGGLLVAWLLGNMTFAFIFIMVPGLLWFYASSYKRQFLLGNFIAAFVVALVPLLVVIFNHQLLINQFGDFIYEVFIGEKQMIPTLYGWTCVFSLFFAAMMFFETFAKDMWNEYGNRELESRTLPVVWGQKKAKIAFVVFVVAFVALLGHLWFHYYFKVNYFETTSLITRYLLFGVLLPFAFLIYLVLRSKKPGDRELVVLFSRFMMLIGLIFTLIFYFVLSGEFGIPLFNRVVMQ